MVFTQFIKWRGPIKVISVKLPGDLHTAVKSAAPARGQTVERAYEEALSQWLAAGTKVLGRSPAKESGEPPVPPAAQPAYDLIQRDIAAMNVTLKEIAARLGMENLRGRYAGPRAKRERDRALVGGKPRGKSGVDISVDGELAKGSGGTGGKND